MGGDVAVLHQLGGEMVCGSDKGRLGRISVSLFEDLDLRNTLRIVKLPPGTKFYLETVPAVSEGEQASKTDAAPAVEHKIGLDQKRVVGPILIRAGYSPYSRIWYGTLSGVEKGD